MCGCWDSWVRVPAHCQSPSAGLTLLESKGRQPAQPAQRGLREQEAAGRQDCFVSLQVLGAPGRGETWIRMGGGWVCFEEDPWEPVLPPGGPREAVSVSLTFLMLKIEVSPVSPPAPRGGSDS